MPRDSEYLAYACHVTPRASGLDAREAHASAALPSGYRFELWEPSVLGVLPPHHPWEYSAWWLFDRARVFANRDYAVGLVWKGERLVQRLGIFPRWYRWPFMDGAADLQLGDLWTDPAHRGQGLASAALRLAMRARADRSRTFWYLTPATNIASVRTAERAGLELVGSATRTRKLGMRKLGQFELSRTERARASGAAVDYSSITELGGDLGSRVQLRRAYDRYYFAGVYCAQKSVLEVACGGGQGLGYLARHARRVTGLDIDPRNLASARETYQGRAGVTVVGGDAQSLPFEDASFDVVLLFEAIYYLADAARFVSEARRVLAPGGTLIVGSVNKDLPGFTPGAFTYRYFGARELGALLERHGFSVQLFATGATSETLGARAFRTSKRLASRLGLIPDTLKMRVALKRVVFGRLVRLPRELEEGVEDYDRAVPIRTGQPDVRHEVLLAVGRLPGAPPQSV